MEKTILAIAPNFISEEGHDLIYHRDFAKAAKKHGLNYIVFLNKKGNSSYGTPFFSPPQGKGKKAFVRFYEFLSLFLRQKSVIFFLESFDLIEFVAYTFAASLMARKKEHWILFRDGPTGKKKTLLLFFLRFLKNKKVLTDSEGVQAFFKEAIVLPVFHTQVVEKKKREETLSLWWPGRPREEKGVKEISELLCTKDTKAKECHLVLSDKFVLPVNPTLPFTLLKQVNREEYLDYLKKSDCILLPYDPIAYKVRTSGIFVEAIVAGKMPLVKGESWMGRELKKFGLEKLIVDWNSSCFFTHLFHLLQDSEVMENLKKMQHHYREFHSVEGLTKALSLIV